MIKLKNIEKVYRTDTIETLALNDINLDVAQGEFLSIMGPSGCGKSTLLNIMGLLDALAIVGKPSIILADEPTGNLDSQMGNEIMEILEQLNKTDGTTIVMVTHDENMAKRTHRLVRLFDGSQVA